MAKSRFKHQKFELMASCALGIQDVARQELIQLGITSDDKSSLVEGGVEFKGTMMDLYRANMWLRTVNRILIRIGTFTATNFEGFMVKSASLSWGDYISGAIAVRVTSKGSKLYHTGGIAERLHSTINNQLGRTVTVIKLEQLDEFLREGGNCQLIVVRIVGDQCTINIDSSGVILHKRGYRQATAKAPLRETLAASMIMLSSWDYKTPFVDPFCGSGTLPIEAAMLSLGVAPGANRKFGFMDWPIFQVQAFEAMKHRETRTQSVFTNTNIFGSDRDAGAIQIAQQNSVRANTSSCVTFHNNAISDAYFPSSVGCIVSNLPFGSRIQLKQGRNLYAQLGKVLRRNAVGWGFLFMISESNQTLFRCAELDVQQTFKIENGGINVLLLKGKV